MFEGVYPALITPFRRLSDGRTEVDHAALESLIDWQLACGVSGLVIYGTTGESATLTTAEKLEITKRTLAHVAGRVPVIAGTGSNSTQASVEFTKQVQSLGVDGALAVAPYYNKPSQEGLFQHFTAIADCGLPVVLYNVPGRTVVSISVETFSRLAEHPNIVACKQAVDSVSELMELSAACADKLTLLAGDDPMVYAFLASGGKGVISASANVLPKEMVALYQRYVSGDIAGSLKAQQDILPIISALFSESNPTPAKAALQMMGKIDDDVVRLPLVSASEAARKLLREVLSL